MARRFSSDQDASSNLHEDFKKADLSEFHNETQPDFDVWREERWAGGDVAG